MEKSNQSAFSSTEPSQMSCVDNNKNQLTRYVISVILNLFRNWGNRVYVAYMLSYHCRYIELCNRLSLFEIVWIGVIEKNLKKMENLTDVWYGPLPHDSPYVRPFRLHYVQNGVEKSRDLLKVHDSVCIIVYNKTTNKLVFVKQFRPGIVFCSFYSSTTRANQWHFSLPQLCTTKQSGKWDADMTRESTWPNIRPN